MAHLLTSRANFCAVKRETSISSLDFAPTKGKTEGFGSCVRHTRAGDVQLNFCLFVDFITEFSDVLEVFNVIFII